jgi:hypothetical protein
LSPTKKATNPKQLTADNHTPCGHSMQNAPP